MAEAVLDSYAFMLAPAEGLLAPLRDILTAAMSNELDTDSRRIFADVIFDVVADVTAQVELIDSGRITLASQTAALPVAIHNGANLAMNVTVKTTSEKLRFPDGEELRITLEPGLNELSIPIETVTSGDARIFITVTSPDGHLDLTDGSVNVRSTAISGLGLVVSLVSLAVLLTWWLRTIIRVRRSQSHSRCRSS